MTMGLLVVVSNLYGSVTSVTVTLAWSLRCARHHGQPQSLSNGAGAASFTVTAMGSKPLR